MAYLIILVIIMAVLFVKNDNAKVHESNRRMAQADQLRDMAKRIDTKKDELRTIDKNKDRASYMALSREIESLEVEYAHYQRMSFI